MKRRRVLILAHDFSPAASAGALRATRLARHLPAFGWEPIVVTATHKASDAPGAPPCTTIYAHGIDAKQTLSWRGHYWSLLTFPDRFASWAITAAWRASQETRRRPADAIFSTSPPVSAHVAALALRARTELPWVAELRDPWNLLHPFGPVLRSIDARLARRVYATADRIVVTTGELGDRLRSSQGEAIGARVRVVANAHEESDFVDAAPAPPTDAFTLVHAGTLGGSYRPTDGLIRGIRLALDRHDLPQATRLDLLGVTAEVEPELRRAIDELDLARHVTVHPRQPHAKALQAIRCASVLVVLQNHDAFGSSLPSKLWEYVRSSRPILAVAPPDSAVARFLEDVPGAVLVPHDEPAAIAASLGRLAHAWRIDPIRAYARPDVVHRADVLAVSVATVRDERANATDR